MIQVQKGYEDNVQVKDELGPVVLQNRIISDAVPVKVEDNYVKNSADTIKSTDTVERSSIESTGQDQPKLLNLPAQSAASPDVSTIENDESVPSPSQMASTIENTTKVHNMNEQAESDFNTFGKFVASQLKKLPEEQAIVAQYEIQSILTRCKLTDLRSRNTNYTTNTALLHNSQFSSLPLVRSATPLIQLPQNNPAGTSTSSGTTLGLDPNYIEQYENCS